jgi:hypothetical protein
MNMHSTSPSKQNLPGPLFSLLVSEDFINREEPDWLIDEILPHAGLASIYGQSGVGKSFICLDMAAAITEGRPWFGFPTKPTAVVYVALEGAAGFPRRVRAWSAYHQRGFPHNIKFVFDAFVLSSPPHTLELGNLIHECGGAGLVIIDTLNRASPGADENTSADMGKIIAGATRLQQAISGMVLLVHHSGKNVERGLRGHSSLKAALDSTIYVDRQEELISWTLDKSKDSEDQLSRFCNLLKVEVGQNKSGKLIHSCVVVEAEGVAVAPVIKEPKGENQKQILAAVQEILVTQRLQEAWFNPEWPDHSSEGLPYIEL